MKTIKSKKNPKASECKLKWNESVNELNKIEKAMSGFRRSLKDDCINSFNLNSYEETFINKVNEFLAPIVKSGRVTTFEGCRYVFRYIKLSRVLYSNKCLAMKCRYKIYSSEFNSKNK